MNNENDLDSGERRELHEENLAYALAQNEKSAWHISENNEEPHPDWSGVSC